MADGYDSPYVVDTNHVDPDINQKTLNRIQGLLRNERYIFLCCITSHTQFLFCFVFNCICCAELGFSLSQLDSDLASNTLGQVTTTYYLLVDKFTKEKKEELKNAEIRNMASLLSNFSNRTRALSLCSPRAKPKKKPISEF